MDDTKLFKAISGMHDVSLLQEELWLVMEWSKINNMQLHEKKFEVLNYVLDTSLLILQLPFTGHCREYITSNEHMNTPTATIRDLGVIL